MPWNDILRLPKRQAGSMVNIGPHLFLDMRKGRADLTFRYRSPVTRKDRLKGLGPLRLAVPDELRERVLTLERKLRDGIDPLEEAKADKQAALLAKGQIKTFAELAQTYLANYGAGWRNEKHRAQWLSSLRRYAEPTIGHRPIADITHADVVDVLRPIWNVVPETASRLRGRLEAIFDHAIACGLRSADNPATWRLLRHTFQHARKVRPVVHYAAVPWQQTPGFLTQLRAQGGIAARALEFTILTAARSGETRFAVWREIDMQRALWTIPASRTKTRKQHVVPLTPAALAVLRGVARYRLTDADLIFPGLLPGRPLSDMTLGAVLRRMGWRHVTTHGFRSSFRDWAAEAADVENFVAEMALGHVVGSSVEAAYRRGTLLEKRTKLMEAWSAFCGSS